MSKHDGFDPSVSRSASATSPFRGGFGCAFALLTWEPSDG